MSSKSKAKQGGSFGNGPKRNRVKRKKLPPGFKRKRSKGIHPTKR